MNQAADALVLEYPQSKYPDSYSRKDLNDHIEDLIFRFKNRALGDTVHRVGRDLCRKLAREDRITGAMLLCARHKLPFDTIVEVYKAALGFAVPAEDGLLFPADEQFRKKYDLGNPENKIGNNELKRILKEVSGLDGSRKEDAVIENSFVIECL